MTVDRTELLTLLDRARALVDDALAKNAQFTTYRSVGAQLDAIKADVERGGSFDPDLQQRVNVGLYAVREFDQSDPELAALLYRISFLYQDEGVLK